ncbi:MAG: hypothetical protein M3Q77_06405 [Thermoproteota archaeon]|nr:hypothetical protein [Thermoproteota archaeon]
MRNLVIIVIGIILFSALSISNAYAVFHREDFLITNMGLNNGVPFMELQGQPGRSFSVDGGDENYYAYTFVTDKGIFAATVSLDEDGDKPYYGVDRFDIKKFQIGECVNHKTATGEPKFTGKLAEYIPKEIIFTNVSEAYALQIIADDPDDDCETGEHIYKIFSSK